MRLSEFKPPTDDDVQRLISVAPKVRHRSQAAAAMKRLGSRFFFEHSTPDHSPKLSSGSNRCGDDDSGRARQLCNPGPNGNPSHDVRGPDLRPSPRGRPRRRRFPRGPEAMSGRSDPKHSGDLNLERSARAERHSHKGLRRAVALMCAACRVSRACADRSHKQSLPSRTVNTLPAFNWLVTEIAPPKRVTSRLQIGRPRPQPLFGSRSGLLSCAYSSKTASNESAGMPDARILNFDQYRLIGRNDSTDGYAAGFGIFDRIG